MRLSHRQFAKLVFAALILSASGSHSAEAQQSAQHSTSSSGISATLVSLFYKPNYLTAQIVLKNNTSARVYLTDARDDDSQRGFLASGPQFLPPSLAGFPVCVSNMRVCITSPDYMALHNFTYIEPGTSLGLSLKYDAQRPPEHDDNFSFSLALIARFAKSDPADTGPPKPLMFNFTFIPISQR